MAQSSLTPGGGGSNSPYTTDQRGGIFTRRQLHVIYLDDLRTYLRCILNQQEEKTTEEREVWYRVFRGGGSSVKE